ncbi:hypothetical protein BZA70DRAFT_265157 [Myxozyma melibiosi]|uniref:Zn(2)-C6 fungal-type domain-containing protein n=1 Tax=Myxozyma melibiosi TaxID=54550 RepID=A0ABR1FFM2_9ASCO
MAPPSVQHKRTKKTRACDQCRKARTRCEDPPAASSSPISSSSKCWRCSKLNRDCTFVLPVVETRGVSSYLRTGQDDQSNPSEDYLQIFQTTFLPCCPIVSPMWFNSSVHSSRVFLTCSMRYIGALLAGAPESDLEEVRRSIYSYIATKSPMTAPIPQNVQALALLALRIEDHSSGIWHVTAVRMATALGWNRAAGRDDPRDMQGDDQGEDRSMTEYLWWTLVCEDIWLYVFSGSPTVVAAGDHRIRRPKAPEFMRDLIALSDIARLLLRPRSVDVPAGYTADDMLEEWEAEHPDIASSSAPDLNPGNLPKRHQKHHPQQRDDFLSPSLGEFTTASLHSTSTTSQQTQTEGPIKLNTTLTPTTIIQLLYAAVVGLFVLGKVTNGSFDRISVTEHPLRHPTIYKACLVAVKFKNTAFARWRCLTRLADIIGAALYVIGDDYGHRWARDRGFGAENVQSLEDLWDWWAVVDKAQSSASSADSLSSNSAAQNENGYGE